MIHETETNPIIGVSTSFTGKYKASQLLIRFLELLDVKLVKTNRTKPSIVEMGTTLASADFCLPLRVYIGHIYSMLKEHPEINIVLAPIIKGEHPSSSTCAKYRDLDGVLIRSLGSMTGYRIKGHGKKGYDSLEELIGMEKAKNLTEKGENLPHIIAPEIESLEKNHLKQVCKKVYTEILADNGMKRFQIYTSNIIRMSNKETRKINQAFEQAYEEVIEKNEATYEKFLKKPFKTRLALMGRNYLVDDPALSANIKAYFAKKGVSVITIQDVPFKYLKNRYEKVNGFYDYHRIGQAFIDTVMDLVDGFIVIGSFGCHPDAFQIDSFAKYITDNGKACWTFKFDEQTGGTGFHTRFETILGFLEQKKEERIGEKATLEIDYRKKELGNIVEKKEPKVPLFIWPHMGTGIDLVIKETWYQLGLDKFLVPPMAVNEETIDRGNREFTETCSPFSLYLGSLRQTLDRLVLDYENAAKEGKKVEPRRIIILMAGGKGPCTFGWYAIAGEKAIKDEFAPMMKKFGHTIEMIAIDNEGRNLIAFLEELSGVAENNRLQNIITKLKSIKALSRIKKTKEEIKLIKNLKNIVWPGWKKLIAYEELQNKALRVRAHELKRGKTTVTLKETIQMLEDSHTLQQIEKAKESGLEAFEQIEQDEVEKPKVVVVGEIYVALTPFANRGTVDNLIGALGIEAIEGMRLSHFIRGAFKGLKYNFIQNQQLLKPILSFLENSGIYNVNQWVREPEAKPFLEHEIGGDGQPTVAHARKHIEEDGVDGILHIYPFKCMPEGIAKDALIEMSQLYGIKSLHLSFDKETEIERLKTELGTFAELLRQDIEKRKGNKVYWYKELDRRGKIGRTIEELYMKKKNKKRSIMSLNANRLNTNLIEEGKNN